MNNEIWVPKGTEIFTPEGWLRVEYLYNRGGEVMAVDVDKGKVLRSKTSAWKQAKNIGADLKEIIADTCLMRYAYAAPIQKSEVFQGFQDTPGIDHIVKLRRFQEFFYSFHTEVGTAILRNRHRREENIVQFISPDQTIFTQDDYEEGLGIGFIDTIAPDEDHFKKLRLSLQAKITAGGFPDYWISYTRW